MTRITVSDLKVQGNILDELEEIGSVKGGQNNGKEPIVNREIYDFLNFGSKRKFD